jgi:hypothetical protein
MEHSQTKPWSERFVAPLWAFASAPGDKLFPPTFGSSAMLPVRIRSV